MNLLLVVDERATKDRKLLISLPFILHGKQKAKKRDQTERMTLRRIRIIQKDRQKQKEKDRKSIGDSSSEGTSLMKDACWLGWWRTIESRRRRRRRANFSRSTLPSVWRVPARRWIKRWKTNEKMQIKNGSKEEKFLVRNKPTERNEKRIDNKKSQESQEVHSYITGGDVQLWNLE